MNLEFVQDLIAACRSDPERFRDLLASRALADILQTMVARIQHLEKEVTQASSYAMARQNAQGPLYGAGTPMQPGQFVEIGVSSQQSLMNQLQNLKQDQAKLMGLANTGGFYLPPDRR